MLLWNSLFLCAASAACIMSFASRELGEIAVITFAILALHGDLQHRGARLIRRVCYGSTQVQDR